MTSRSSRYGLFLASSVVAAIVAAACGSNSEDVPPGTSSFDDASSNVPPGGDDDDDDVFGEGGAGEAGTQDLDVQPSALQTVDVVMGQAPAPVAFTATMNGAPASAAWSVDRGEIGSIPAGPSTGASFTASGSTGGLATISASLNGQVVRRQVMVQVSGSQNGYDPSVPSQKNQVPTTVADLTAGGGVGGVGGEGLGGAVTDPAITAAFAAPTGDGSAQNLALLYPYDKTVFPRGVLAPLLQWSWSIGDADAVSIQLETTSKSFSWKGTFGRPAILATTGGKFVRMPIPQNVWEMATNSAGATTTNGIDKLTVSLMVARAGKAYGPIKETWTIAPGRLSGTIYYNSYGTRLAKNHTGAVGGDGKFGGAVLGIRVGDTAPKLVAGGDGGDANCRVCHSVASNGSSLIAQRGDNNSISALYSITPASVTESATNNSVYPGMYPDGTGALTTDRKIMTLPGNTTATPTGLDGYAELGTPVFSPDGKQVAFNPLGGSAITNPNQKLVVMNYDPATKAFSGGRVVFDGTGQPAETRPGWAAFLPDGKSLVFQRQSAAGVDGNGLSDLRTRKGALAQIFWTSAADATKVTALDQLNGKGYLPKLSTPTTLGCTGDGAQVGGIQASHEGDVDLNYEPTVNPIATGGYAWVVFTSRRMYGNEATIPPFCSDPRGVDLVQNITTKKLWVAAIDLNAAPGTDASHPAFYLPAQELLAGNARGFWVLDPCKSDGQSCSSGDQCCNGSCGAGEAGLVCGAPPPNATCATTSNKCSDAMPCCNANDRCVGGFCTARGPV